MAIKIDIGSVRDEIELFSSDVPENDDDFIWERVDELCSLYNLDESQFSGEWAAFSAGSSAEQIKFDTENLNLLEQHLIRSRRNEEKGSTTESASQDSEEFRAVPRPTQKKVSSAEIFSLYGGALGKVEPMDTIDDHHEVSSETAIATPKSRSRSSVANTPVNLKMDLGTFSPLEQTPLSKKYEDRENAKQILCSFGRVTNSGDFWKSDGEPTESMVKLVDPKKSLEKGYKYMFQKVPDVAEALIEQCEAFGDQILERMQLEEFANVRQPNQEKVIVCGQIYCDGMEKMNPSSVMLQGSMHSSMGCSVQVDPTSMQEYSFFPGQVTALEGINPSGRMFIAEKQIPGFVPAQCELKKEDCNLDKLNVVVACGPFTTMDSLAYQPLYDLLTYVADNKPNLVILIGPFVDAKSKQVEEAKLHRTFTDIFERILVRIAEITEDCGAEVLIVPSAMRDVHHDPIYPCPPFRAGRAESKMHKRMHMMSDPCMVNVGGVAFGISGTDILMQLGAEEISMNKTPASTDRMSRLLKHLMLQNSFYPLYPAPLNFNMEFEMIRKYCGIEKLPHVLIVPSDLKYFIKNVEDVYCVNPGRLARGQGGGFFGRLSIDLKNMNETDTSVVDKIGGEILRI